MDGMQRSMHARVVSALAAEAVRKWLRIEIAIMHVCSACWVCCTGAAKCCLMLWHAHISYAASRWQGTALVVARTSCRHSGILILQLSCNDFKFTPADFQDVKDLQCLLTVLARGPPEIMQQLEPVIQALWNEGIRDAKAVTRLAQSRLLTLCNHNKDVHDYVKTVSSMFSGVLQPFVVVKGSMLMQ